MPKLKSNSSPMILQEKFTRGSNCNDWPGNFLVLHSTEYLFLSLGTIAEGAPVVPISAQLKYNIEVICEFICKKIPVPVRDFKSSARLIGRYFHWVF